MFQRLSHLLYSIYLLFCVSMLATYCLLTFRWKETARRCRVSCELLCYIADIPFPASYRLGTKRTEIKSDRGETLPGCRILYLFQSQIRLLRSIGPALPSASQIDTPTFPLSFRARALMAISLPVRPTHSLRGCLTAC